MELEQNNTQDKWTQTSSDDDAEGERTLESTELTRQNLGNFPSCEVSVPYLIFQEFPPIKYEMVDNFTNTDESYLNSRETGLALDDVEWKITESNFSINEPFSIPITRKSVRIWMDKPGGRLSQELHPMKNEIILKLIFKSCDVESLKSSRLVCRQWRDVSMNSWRQKAVISLTNYRTSSKLSKGSMPLCELSGFVKSSEAGMDNFEFTLDILKKPFQNYKFTEKILIYKRSWLNHQFFLRTFHEHIKFLEIPFSARETPCQVLVDDIILKLPNLHELRLRFEMDRNPYRGNDYPDSNFKITSGNNAKNMSIRSLEILGMEDRGWFYWNNFLHLMPNLKRLKIGNIFIPNVRSSGSDWMESILQAVWNRKCPMVGYTDALNLNELDIQPTQISSFPNFVSGLISECQIPLSKLTIKVGQIDNKNIGSLKELLEGHTKTLETLILITGNNINYPGFPGFNTPIQFENLRELRLYSDATWAHKFVENIVAPTLEQLVLEQCDELKLDSESWFKLNDDELKLHRKSDIEFFIESDFSESPLVSLKQLNRFECKFHWNLFTPEKIEEFGRIMPNLKHLVLPLNPKSFQSVCRTWPKLWTLKVVEPEIFEDDDDDDDDDDDEIEEIQIGDEAITGIPVSDSEISGEFPRNPNITDLKELTDFSIESRSKSILTDKSVIDGFLKLPRLHYLNVTFKEISDATRILLEAHVPYCHISV